MNMQEMLTTKNLGDITDEDIRAAAYAITYGEFAIEVTGRQRELKKRLRELEAKNAAKRTEKRAALQEKLQRLASTMFSDEDAYADR